MNSNHQKHRRSQVLSARDILKYVDKHSAFASPFCSLCFGKTLFWEGMAADSRNREVLKLVHPGGIKEIHRRPIKACEVMKKYPRHCVTRPDVFKFPWIVVHPDSVLKPGGVFYVVPNHTLYCLKRDDSPGKKSCVRENDFFEEIRTDPFLCPDERNVVPFYDFQDQKSPSVSGSRPKIDCKYEDWQGDDIFPDCLLRPGLNKQSSSLDGAASPKNSWRSGFGIKNRQESKPKSPLRSFFEMDDTFPNTQNMHGMTTNKTALRHASPQESKQCRPLKYLFEMEATKSQKEVYEVDHQRTAMSFNGLQETKQESPVKSDRFAKLKTKQTYGDSPRKRYPVEGWERTLNFKYHQEASKHCSLKSLLGSNHSPRHHSDSPKNIYMVEPVQSPFNSSVEPRRPDFSSDIVSMDDKPTVVPAKADGVCESSSSNKDGRTLKSCLKKNNSARPHGLRVKFGLSGEDEEKLRVEVFEFEPTKSPPSVS